MKKFRIYYAMHFAWRKLPLNRFHVFWHMFNSTLTPLIAPRKNLTSSKADPARFLKHYLIQIECCLHYFEPEIKNIHPLDCPKQDQGGFFCRDGDRLVLENSVGNILLSIFKRVTLSMRSTMSTFRVIYKGYQDETPEKMGERWLVSVAAVYGTTFELVRHYSITFDLAPSIYHLFHNMKNVLEGKQGRRKIKMKEKPPSIHAVS